MDRLHTDGTHRELIAVPESNVFPLDDAIDFETGGVPARLRDGLPDARDPRPDQERRMGADLGIGGGVATAAFEIARAAGAKTLVTSSSEASSRQRANGAWTSPYLTRKRRPRRRLGGVDLVVETVGEATWKDSLGAVKAGGRVVVCEPPPANPPAQLRTASGGSSSPCGSTMGTRSGFLGAYELVRSGRARCHVDSTFPLAEARAAHERMGAASSSARSCSRSPESSYGELEVEVQADLDPRASRSRG